MAWEHRDGRKGPGGVGGTALVLPDLSVLHFVTKGWHRCPQKTTKTLEQKITYSPDYCTQQGSHSSMKEKSKAFRFAINQKHAGAPPPLLVPSGKDWKWTAQFPPPPLSGVPSNLPWASLQSPHQPQPICETSSHLSLLTPNPRPPDDRYQEIHRCSIIRHLPDAWGPWHTRVFLPSKSMDPKSSHHKRKKKFFFFYYLYEMMEVH